MDLVIISHVMIIKVGRGCSKILRSGQSNHLGIAARTARTGSDWLIDSLWPLS